MRILAFVATLVCVLNSASSQAFQACELRIRADREPVIPGDIRAQLVLTVERMVEPPMIGVSLETAVTTDPGTGLMKTYKRVTHYYQLKGNEEIRLDPKKSKNTIKVSMVDPAGQVIPVTLTFSELKELNYDVGGSKPLEGHVAIDGIYHGKSPTSGIAFITDPSCFLPL